MNFRKLVRNLYAFLLSQRQSGTTTLLKKIAAENDVWVLVPNATMKNEFGESTITFDDLSHAQGRKVKPIFMDNFTMMQLCEFFENELIDKDLKITKQYSLINKIKTDIEMFERLNCKYDNKYIKNDINNC